MAGNANYDGPYAYSVALEIDRIWTMTFITALPFIGMLRGKDNGAGQRFNNKRIKRVEGTRFLLPTNYAGPSTTARHETSSTLGAQITPYAISGFTHAEFYYGFFSNAMYVNIQQYATLVGSTNMIPVEPGAVKQLLWDMLNVISTDLVSSTNGTGYQGGNGAIMGELYPLSTSNSPGNISQSTYANWQAGVISNVGGFNESLITNEFDRILALGRGPADFCQLSYTSSNNVYNKLRGLIGTTQVLETQEDHARYGFRTFEAYGLTCFMDNVLGTNNPGSMIVGASDSWCWDSMMDEPQLARTNGVIRYPSTVTEEHMYYFIAGLGISDPARNTYISGIT